MKTPVLIFKLQRPLSDPSGPVLAYDQYKQHTRLLPHSAALDKLFADRLKIYVRATVDGEDLDIIEVVADRSW